MLVPVVLHSVDPPHLFFFSQLQFFSVQGNQHQDLNNRMAGCHYFLIPKMSLFKEKDKTKKKTTQT